MNIIDLDIADAEKIVELASQSYPHTYSNSLEDIQENLSGRDQDSFFLGVEDDGGVLVGYFMAWLDNTMIEGKTETVCLIDDIALKKKARLALFALLEEMIADMEERGHGLLPIEGSSRPNAGSTFLDHPEVMERLGYELVAKAEYYEEEFQEDLTWVRFEPILREDAVINVQDTLELSIVATDSIP